jgi:hypothetical protein
MYFPISCGENPNLTNLIGNLHANQYTFQVISRLVLLRMRNVSEGSCRENQTTFYVKYLFPENRPFNEIILKNIVESKRPQVTI